MKTFLSVAAALIAVPLLGMVGCTALLVSSSGEIHNREQDCMRQHGLSLAECERIVSAEVFEEFNQSRQELGEAAGELRRTLGYKH